MTTPSVPVLLLSGAGIVIAVLALFAAGNVALMAVGLGAVFAAGLLHVAELAIRSRAGRDGEGGR